MPPRSVSNSGSATPPRPNRRAASPRSPSPVRSERAPPPENNQEPKIVIFKLAEETTEDELRSHFQSCGSINRVFIKPAAKGGLMAFMDFCSVEQAQKGTEMSGTELKGASINVQMTRPRSKKCFICEKEGHMKNECPQAGNGNAFQERSNKGPMKCFKCNQEGHMSRQCPGVMVDEASQEPKINVNNLPDEVTEEDLRNHFQACGEITEIRILKKNNTFAFISFTTLEQAKKGLELSGSELLGSSIRVMLAKPRPGAPRAGGDRHQQTGHMVDQAAQKPEINVNNLPDEVTEEDLRNHFQACGQITGARIIRKNNTFAFVTFSALEQAKKALELSGSQLLGNQIKVNLAKSRAGGPGAGGDGQRTKSCYKCHKEGHFSRECPGAEEEMVPEEKPEQSRPFRRSVSNSASGSVCRGKAASPPQESKPFQRRNRSLSQHSASRSVRGVRNSPPRNNDRSEQVEKGPRIRVFAIADSVTRDDFRALFEPYGNIVDLFFKVNERGPFGFITFSSAQEAEKATELNGTDVQGKEIRIQYAGPRPGGDKPKDGDENVNQNRSRACFSCHKEGHMSRDCPEPSNFNRRPPRRQNHHFRREMVDERVIGKKLTLVDPFTGGEFVFPSGRQDYINPRLKIDRPQEARVVNSKGAMDVEPELPKQQVVIEIEDSPVRITEEAATLTEEKLVKSGFQTSRQVVASRSRSRDKQARNQSLDDEY